VFDGIIDAGSSKSPGEIHHIEVLGLESNLNVVSTCAARCVA